MVIFLLLFSRMKLNKNTFVSEICYFTNITKLFKCIMTTFSPTGIQQNYTETSSTIMTSELDEDIIDMSQYVGALVVTWLLVVMGIYLVVCLLFYEYRVKIKNQQIGQLNRQRQNLIRDRVADWLRWLCLIASILALVRFGLEIVEIKLGESSSIICDPIRKSKAVLQCAVITCLYLVLWLRQRKFYGTPAMLHLSNKIIRFFSRSVIIIMAIANVLTITLYVATRGYQSSGRGCRLEWSSIWTKLPGLLQFIFTTLFQVILLGLFIYPLYKHRVAMKSVVSNSPNNEIKVIKRVTLATVVAVVTDGLAGLVALVAFSKSFGALRQLIYDVDMLVNLLAIICSFADWRTRLAPFLVKQEKIVGTVKRKLIDNQRTEVTTVSNNV
ncbi:uncharacterized protein LOC143460335 [Clavelina lepadiformis]|uniref:uncharacterized protein LOC143460335 n=1 Tax=Clavelina lepadiformis TaxID=159417 RepID=UPI004042C686